MQEVNTQAEFNSIIASNEQVAVFFMADWCGVCRSMKPLIGEVEEDFPSIKFLMVDVDQNEDTAAHHGIRSVPIVKFYKYGSEFGSGLLGRKEIENRFKYEVDDLLAFDRRDDAD